MGRRLIFTPLKKGRFIQLIETGNTVGSVCKVLNITAATYRHHRTTDKEFAEQVDLAKLARDELVEDALYLSALSGNVNAQIFYLCNRRPDRWRSVNRDASKTIVEAGTDQEGLPRITYIEVRKDYREDDDALEEPT